MNLRLARLALVAAALCVPGHARAADTDIRLNSVGYLPLRSKLAAVVGTASAFTVVRDADAAVVLSGALSLPVNDVDTGESVLTADFTALAEPGTYHLEVDGVGRSASFPIDGDVYRGPFVTSMLGFYGWRCGTDVAFDYAGVHYGYPACHRDDAHLEAIGGTGTRDGTGGWHDAGDYGKYTVNAALTLGLLLGAWEDFQPAIEPTALQIPETGGRLPDFLAELKWELSWLLKMQYSPTDGRVSHKITEATHPGFIMPQADTAERSFVPYGTAATADFAAVLAKASRAYRPYDPTFADQCLAAARVSYDYLVANPTNVPANETGFISTQYASSDDDDRLWAAAEIWESTGDAAALADFEKRATPLAPKVSPDFDWPDLKNLGMVTYLGSSQCGRSDALVGAIAAALTTAADTLVSNHKSGAYGRSLTNYYWGVNGSLARTCYVLQHAYRVAPSSDYIDTCADQLAFLFGHNPFDRSFVTGVGYNPPLHPHHRPSAADGITAPYPGLLIGGGWVYRAIDGISACTQPAGLCWSDVQANYEVNEVAINWNAGLVYALAGFLGGGAQIPAGSGLAAAGSGAAGASSACPTGAAGSDAAAGAGAGSGAVPGSPHHASRTGCGCRTGGSADPRAAVAGALMAFAALRRRRHMAKRARQVK